VEQATPNTDPRRYPFRACGEDVSIYPGAKIVSPEVVSIGDSVLIDDFVFLMGGVETRIGSFCHLSSFSTYLGAGRLVIEDYVGIASGVRLYSGIDDFSGETLIGGGIPKGFREPKRSFLHVGRYVSIGANSVVFPGVTLGEGCAIGAMSLVNRDCEPWTIYVGCPARPLKSRRRDRIESYDREIRARVYDSSGRYIPRRERGE
jgi:acetyltransferase-like isoleucine patch superfamily enzyme